MALEILLTVSSYIRSNYPFCIRLNTNGLSDMIYSRPTAKEIYGEKAFEAMLRFAQDCKKYLENVRFSVVDIIGEENVKKSQMLADSLAIPLYIRTYS